MAIEIRESVSDEMQKRIKTVKKMSNGMGFDENMANVNWSAVRRISNFGYKFMQKEKGVKFKKLKLDNIKAEMAIPNKLTNDNIIMYIHGGGFVSGSASSSRGYCSMLASYSGCRVIAADYSLAPEKPYPNGVNDCISAYKSIIEMFSNPQIALVGESAGANLCLITALKAMDLHIKKPSCVIVHSPFVDFCGSLDRTQHYVDDFTVKEGCLKPLNDIYVNGYDASLPYISPIYGDFKDFPPLYISCDYNETLFADSMALYEKCDRIGVNVNMLQMKGAFHAFAAIGTGTPETKQILIENTDFIKECFSL